jgi:formamidopyrimidine-DNA glycosylase
MPELPEVEIVKRGLKSKLPGETVQKVEILREQSIGYPQTRKFITLLEGRTFSDVSRRGKYLLLHLSNKKKEEQAFLLIHLRMSGRLLFIDELNKKKNLPRFLRVRILMKSGKALYFEDMRVFGRISFIAAKSDLDKSSPSFNQLGIEPLEKFTSQELLSLFEKRNKAIKTALLDQTLIAGIGNIYADEILFQAGIHPLLPASKITEAQAKLLTKIIPDTLKRAINRGGSTIKDFVDSEGVNGNYQHQSLVYGRTNKPCKKCKSPVQRLKIVGRSSHFCGNCQKL